MNNKEWHSYRKIQAREGIQVCIQYFAVRFLVWVTKRVCLSLEIGFAIVVVTLGFLGARYYIRVLYCSVQVTILGCKYFSLLVAQNTPLRNSVSFAVHLIYIIDGQDVCTIRQG